MASNSADYYASHDRYAETPIIFLTAKQYELNTRLLIDDLRVAAVFGKPFSPEFLVSTVTRELTKSVELGDFRSFSGQLRTQAEND